MTASAGKESEATLLGKLSKLNESLEDAQDPDPFVRQAEEILAKYARAKAMLDKVQTA